MRAGPNRLKIVCRQCRGVVAYWVRDEPPDPHQIIASADVQFLDGSKPKHGSIFGFRCAIDGDIGGAVDRTMEFSGDAEAIDAEGHK